MANPNRQSNPHIEKSEQAVLNQSFDREFNVLAVENLVYNPTTGAMDRQEVGFANGADITTDLSGGSVITQTDGTKTLTITITGSTITEEWS